MPDMATFAMPGQLTIREDNESGTYAKFVAEPFEKGFGHTLGNALRRILLSSMEGVAISSVRFDGVPHEFTTIPNVIEDVTDIILNFKKVLLESTGDMPRTFVLKASHAGDVTAAQIQCDSLTTVLNPTQHLFTIDKNTHVHVEIEVDRGRGYRPAEENKRDDHPIGVIPVDCLFSPIRQVAYAVQGCRVGQRTDYDSVEIEVHTDGRIAPKDAVKEAAQILLGHLPVFTGIGIPQAEDTTCIISNPEDEALLRKLMLRCPDLELSVRAKNCLSNASIAYVGELVSRSENELLKYRNFGQKSLDELKEKMLELGLTLNMDIKEHIKVAMEVELEKQKANMEG